MLSTQSPPNSTSVKGSLTPSASSPQIKLRDYQKKFIRDVYREIRNQRKRILGVAPTGAGKTIISAKIVKDAVSRGRRVLFVVHRDILVQQTSEKFAFFGLECGFIKSGWQENQQALVQIASVQTMESRSWWRNWPVELVILDECHLTAFSTIIQEMREQVHQNALYLGITATPWRLKSTEGMGDIFTALVCAPLPSTLINQGFLVKPAYFGSDLAEDAQIEIDEEGDFNEKKLAIAYDEPEMIQEGLKQWQRLAYGRRTIIFAVNVTHSQHICEAFTKAGIPSAHVDGRTSIKKRRKIYQQLGTGEILMLSSCMALTEGFDVGAVSAVVLWRKTLSKALYVQMVGRGLRLSPETDKIDCLVLDLVGNVERHGFIESLKNIQLLKGGQGGNERPAPSKVCPLDDGGCGAILYAFQTVCPHCQYPFEAKGLVKALKLKQMLRPEDVERVNQYRELLLQAYHLKHAPTWAAMRFKDQYGHFPPLAWGNHAIFGQTPPSLAMQQYRQHLEAIASRLEKESDWIERYFKMEFSS